MTDPEQAGARDAFYVGYLPEAPPELASWIRGRVILLLLVVVLVSLALAGGMSRFSSAAFEFGTLRTFEGVLRADPYPRLEVERPGTHVGDDIPAHSSYLVVAEWKFGADDQLTDFVDKRVRLEGTLIHREGRTMVELVSGSVVLAEDSGELAARPAPPDVDHGTLTLRGEIVDSKCFLGVMKPGHAKPHRACATRCISGGIPPVLMVRSTSGSASYHLLVDPDGAALNAHVLAFVAEPVAITGRVVTRGDLSFLYADPTDIERLP